MLQELIDNKFADAPTRAQSEMRVGGQEVNVPSQAELETAYLQVLCLGLATGLIEKTHDVPMYRQILPNFVNHFSPFARPLSGMPGASTGDLMIVRPKGGDLGLLFLSARFDDNTNPRDIELSEVQLEEAISVWLHLCNWLSPLQVGRTRMLLAQKDAFLVDLLRSEARRGPVRLAFASTRPTREAAAPVPMWGVKSPPCIGTVGSVVKDRNGNAGVTIARHVWKALQSPATVMINGQRATYCSDDLLTDSCFFTLPGMKSPSNSAGVAGPMTTHPRIYLSHTFEGATSGPKSVTLAGAMPFCNMRIPGMQKLVWTSTGLQPGDSGAALIDPTNDEIVGFAFAYGDPNINGSYDSWIWADSVYQAHGLSEL